MGPPTKQSVMAMRKPRRAFGPTVHMIALGIVREASCNSSPDELLALVSRLCEFGTYSYGLSNRSQ